MVQKYLDYKGVQTLVYNIKNKSIPLSQKGVANGVATLDGSGKVPTSQLPSYVDDVLEFNNYSSFPIEGEKGKIYIDISTTPSSVYRWTGTTYLQITGIIGAQGETGAQGYRGYRGYQGYQGLQGTKGIQGTTGLQGTKGTTGAQGETGLQGIQGFQGFQGKSGVDGVQGFQGETGLQGIRGIRGFQGFQGITGPQGPSRFDSRIISVTPPNSTTNNTLSLMARGTVRGYKYISLTNATNPTKLVVKINYESNDIEHVVLLKNDTNSEISFNNLNSFIFKYDDTECQGLFPNDLGYFSLNRGEAVEISFMYNSEFGGIIVSLGNIYTSI